MIKHSLSTKVRSFQWLLNTLADSQTVWFDYRERNNQKERILCLFSRIEILKAHCDKSTKDIWIYTSNFSFVRNKKFLGAGTCYPII